MQELPGEKRDQDTLGPVVWFLFSREKAVVYFDISSVDMLVSSTDMPRLLVAFVSGLGSSYSATPEDKREGTVPRGFIM